MFHQYICLVVFKYRVLESGFPEVKFHPAVYIRLCLYVKMLGISLNDKNTKRASHINCTQLYFIN